MWIVKRKLFALVAVEHQWFREVVKKTKDQPDNIKLK